MLLRLFMLSHLNKAPNNPLIRLQRVLAVPTIQIFLPVDLTGLAPGNLITNELHQSGSPNKAIIRPDFGDFFTNGFQLYGVGVSGALTLLRHINDYIFGHLNEDATQAAGAPVYQVVLVKNTQFFTTFSISYHAFGGQVNNINNTSLYTAYLQASGGMITPFENLTDLPSTFPPEHHTHDIADVYGMEYIVSLLSNMADTMFKDRFYRLKYAELHNKLIEYSVERQASDMQLPNAIRQHIDGTGFPHPTSKASVGLGNVSNYAFTPVVVGGDTLPAYGSPIDISYWLSHQPPASTYTHRTEYTNPHQTDKEGIGLGLVSNLGIVVNYTTGDYISLFDTGATQVYVGPAPFALGMAEYGTATYTSETQPLVDAALSLATGRLSTANDILATAASVRNDYTSNIEDFEAGKDLILENSNQARLVNANYSLLYGNSVYCDTLERVMDFDRVAYGRDQSIFETGYMPVPKYIDGLELWLSSENPQNVLFVDMHGDIRVTKLVDMSPRGRVFSGFAETAPILKNSQDVYDEVSGITTGKVLSFTPGLCLTRMFGPFLRIKPGMTIIALVRSGESGSQLKLLSSPNELTDVGVYAYTSNGKSLAIRPGGSWSPLEAPVGSAQPHTSGIVVGSISESSEEFCWLASTAAIDNATFPRGVAPNVSAWPGTNYIGADMNQIGNSNFGINNSGEIADILIYNRPLSVPEVKVIAAYLQLRFSNSTALAVDYSAISAF